MSKVVKASEGAPGKKPPSPSVKKQPHIPDRLRRVVQAGVSDYVSAKTSRASRRVH
jgi:hypothetical protein